MYDTDGHGTAVAGLVGADRIGVARAAKIFNVKVLGAGGYTSRLDLYTTAFHDIIKAHLRDCELTNDADMSFRGSIMVL